MNKNEIQPNKVLPTLGSMAEVMADPRNADRPVQILDAANTALMIAISNKGMATISCNIPKAEAARLLRRIAQSLDPETAPDTEKAARTNGPLSTAMTETDK